jgi:hypothetical protein
LTHASLRSLNWALVINTLPYARNSEGHTNRTPLMTVASTTPTALLTKGMGAQVPHVKMGQQTGTVQIIENAKGQILLRYFARKLRELSAKSLTSARNVAHSTRKVTVIPTTVREDAGRIAQGN